MKAKQRGSSGNNRGTLNDPLDPSPYNKNEYPFTGHGFTSGQNGRLGVPEWKADFGNYMEILDGTEMYKIDKNGNELLLGVYDDSLDKFISK